MKGLFLLELDAAAPDDLDEEKPLISLNAITGISAVETMTLHVHLLDSVVEALVDSGSTHSFISADTTSRLHLQPVYRLGLQVTVPMVTELRAPAFAETFTSSLARMSSYWISLSFHLLAIRWY
jgi:hypothetical protein